MTKLTIYKNRIKHNLEIINSLSKNNIYILKDNAYGMGIENIAKVISKLGFKYYGVSTVDEALKIRKNVKDARILILSVIEPKDLKKAKEYDLEISLSSVEILKEYLKFTNINLFNIPVHIKINTGLNRLGFNIDELNVLNNFNLNIKSIYSHLADVNNKDRTKKQIENFEKAISKTKIKKAHLLATPGLFKFKDKYLYDYCRVGMSIYGLNEDMGLVNAFALMTKIIAVRNIKKGEYILYSSDYIAKKDMTVAIIPVGYSHGNIFYNHVMINNKRAKILAKPCMDMSVIDISGIKVNLFDDVYIIGNGITVNMIAKKYKTIPDEIVTSISTDIERVVK
ncbi:alanine racemase [Caviibacter abscessus]|uniref:alanine racemase n=1 Tax=Caviibacter abscessus TaxID=1766719 RepID=UPI00082BAE06|nr:alanine racemase [Caviibacter abscessus]